MKLKDLLGKYTDKQIVDSVIKWYPDQKRRGYQHALKILRSKKARKTVMSLLIEYVPADGKWVEKGEEYYRVLGRSDQDYALSFTSWSEWLGMEIKEDQFAGLSEIEALGHILWGMTYHGYDDKDVTNFKKKLVRRVKDIDAQITNNQKEA